MRSPGGISVLGSEAFPIAGLPKYVLNRAAFQVLCLTGGLIP